MIWRSVRKDAKEATQEDAQKVCSEAYQAVGVLADVLGYWDMAGDDPRQHQISKLLDNLLAGADGRPIPHQDLLPFGWQASGPSARAAGANATASPGDLVTLPAPGSPLELLLVVDDDNAVRQVTVEMALDLGYEVAEASGGEQALALIDRLHSPPKLILLDYAMPGMNGLQLARELRTRGVIAPIAIVTGYAELLDADIAAGQLAGVLRKPFTIRELHGLLSQMQAAANRTGRNE